MKFKLLTLAVASVCAFSAHANTTNWGTHGPLELAASITPVGAFEDSYLFNLGTSSAIFSTTVANNNTSMLGISGGMVALYKEAGAVDTLVGDFAFSGVTGNGSHAFGVLSSGDYYYDVTGTSTGALGGFYTITSTITPVPEPQTYALLLAGLGVIGFLGRRRQS